MSESFESLYGKALEAAGKGPSESGGRTELRRAERDARRGADDLARSLSRAAEGEANAFMTHGSETFYGSNGSPGHPVEISLLVGRTNHGWAPDARFSVYIERNPEGWSATWHAYVPYGKSGTNAAIEKIVSGEIATRSRSELIERVVGAYRDALRKKHKLQEIINQGES